MSITLLPNPLFRISAEGRILAGYLTEQTAFRVPEFVNSSPAIQDEIRSQFGTSSPDQPIPDYKLRHVEEPEVIQMLLPLSGRLGGPPVLHNLVGIEWVGLQGIVAGHYVAGPMPLQGSAPRSGATVREIAAFCLAGAVSATSLHVSSSTPLQNTDLDFTSPVKFRLRPNLSAVHPQGFTIDFLVEFEPAPIAVLLLEDRLIALSHQERLVALIETGFSEALCLVHYGFGLEALKSLPTIDASQLASPRPPLVSDFSNTMGVVRIPVRTPRTLVRVSQQTVDLTSPH